MRFSKCSISFTIPTPVLQARHTHSPTELSSLVAAPLRRGLKPWLMLIMFPGGEHGRSVARFTGPVNLSFGFEDGHADLDYDDARAGRIVCGLLLGFVFACKFFFDPLKPRPNFSIEVADGPGLRAQCNAAACYRLSFGRQLL